MTGGDLFGALVDDRLAEARPLAARMRPERLDEIVGQERLLAPGGLIAGLAGAERAPSLLLHGPPGSGKTTLARVVARMARAELEELSAVSAGLADVRGVISRARDRLAAGRRTILFLDEIHRFNRAQQDALLPAVEDGLVTLIGATTENPYYEVNAALLSRMRVLRLDPIDPAATRTLIERALASPRGLGGRFGIDADALDALVARAGGDARHALNLVEAAAAIATGERIDLATVRAAGGGRSVVYDRSGDAHYDTVSAFIKSLRGSDPDAAVYYLAVMLQGGEDPMFIARRLVIAAAEDVGNADPTALVVASAAADAVRLVGMPEARIILAQATVHLALSPKSNAAYRAISAALERVERDGAERPPLALRDASRPNARGLGHGTGYRYPHDFPNAVMSGSLLPEALAGTRFYEPTDRGAEADLAARLARLREGAPSQQPSAAGGAPLTGAERQPPAQEHGRAGRGDAEPAGGEGDQLHDEEHAGQDQ